MSECHLTLVQAAIAGDREAFTRLVVLYGRYVSAIAFRVLKNAHEAEDVAQDVFVLAMQKLHTLRDPGAFATWLGRMARNAALNAQRRTKDALSRAGAEIQPKDVPVYVPQDTLERAEEHDEVWRQTIAAVAELPPRLRLVVESFYLRGDLIREIAEKRRMPVGTVKQYLHTARARLREVLAK